MSNGVPNKIGPFEVVYLIGCGAHAKVYQGYNHETGDRVALKVIDRNKLKDESVLKAVETEIRITEQIKHKNVVSFHKLFYLKDYIVIAMECLSNGSLSNFKVNSFLKLDDSVNLRWRKDILEGLNYLHKKGIVHHDVKPDNIGFDDFMNIKLFDLDLCEECVDNIRYNRCGTPVFTAPEVFGDKEYDGTKADIWSFGVTFHYLVTGVLPFKTLKNFSNVRSMKNIDLNICNVCPMPLREIIDYSLVMDPEKRMSAEELLKLSIFKGADPYYSPNKRERRLSSYAIKNKMTKKCIISPANVIHDKKLKRRISDVTMFQKTLFMYQ